MIDNNNILLAKTQTEIDTRFSPKKTRSQYLSMLYHNIGDDSKSFRVFHCGDFLEFHLSADDFKLARADFCKDRFCPMCQWRRSLKVFGQVSQILDYLDKGSKSYRYLFLTLTVKNCSLDSLSSSIDLLKRSLDLLFNRKEFKSFVCGSFSALEITRNSQTEEYHPHLHCILAVLPSYFHSGSYVKTEKLALLWQSCLKVDYLPVVDIRTVKGRVLDDSTVDYSKAVAEVSKYSVKDKDFLLLDDLDKAESILLSLLSSLSHRRLCSFTGIFKDVRKLLNLDDFENGDLVHTDNDELRPDVSFMVVKYHWKSGCYVSG